MLNSRAYVKSVQNTQTLKTQSTNVSCTKVDQGLSSNSLEGYPLQVFIVKMRAANGQ